MIAHIFNEESFVTNISSGVIVAVVIFCGGWIIKYLRRMDSKLGMITELKDDHSKLKTAHHELKNNVHNLKETVNEHTRRLQKIEIHIGPLSDH